MFMFYTFLFIYLNVPRSYLFVSLRQTISESCLSGVLNVAIDFLTKDILAWLLILSSQATAERVPVLLPFCNDCVLQEALKPSE